MKKTIFGNPIKASNNEKNSTLGQLDAAAELDSGSAAVATMDPEDGLYWLDEGLPDLSSVSHHHFDLAKEFDISRYLNILADEVASEGPHRNIAPVPSASQPGSAVDKSSDASTVAPLASAWAM
jgi:hypothetical protein